jgi:hypothetical protein
LGAIHLRVGSQSTPLLLETADLQTRRLRSPRVSISKRSSLRSRCACVRAWRRSTNSVHHSGRGIVAASFDFAARDRWLTRSSACQRNGALSSNPVTLGAKDRELDPFAVRKERLPGSNEIAFHQPLTMSLRSGTVDATRPYISHARSRFDPPPASRDAPVLSSLALLQPLLVHAFFGRKRTQPARPQDLRTGCPGLL